MRSLLAPKPARDHHPQPHHVQILLSLIVRERHPIIPQKAQHGFPPIPQPQYQIMSRSALLAALPPAEQGRQRLVMGQRLPQQLVVASLDPLQQRARQRLAAEQSPQLAV